MLNSHPFLGFPRSLWSIYGEIQVGQSRSRFLFRRTCGPSFLKSLEPLRCARLSRTHARTHATSLPRYQEWRAHKHTRTQKLTLHFSYWLLVLPSGTTTAQRVRVLVFNFLPQTDTQTRNPQLLSASLEWSRLSVHVCVYV